MEKQLNHFMDVGTHVLLILEVGKFCTFLMKISASGLNWHGYWFPSPFNLSGKQWEGFLQEVMVESVYTLETQEILLDFYW